MVQLVNGSDIKKNQLNGSELQGLQLDRTGLDTVYCVNPDNPAQPQGYCSSTSGRWQDAPASSLTDTTWLSRTDSFTAYLMFQPAVLSGVAIPVPMYAVNWGWSGVARTNGTLANFALLSSSPPSPQVSLTSVFPQWANNATNASWVTNSTPFDEN